MSISSVPIIQNPQRVQRLHRYSYVWNNPLNATDPSGFMKQGMMPSQMTDDPVEEKEPEKIEEVIVTGHIRWDDFSAFDKSEYISDSSYSVEWAGDGYNYDSAQRTQNGAAAAKVVNMRLTEWVDSDGVENLLVLDNRENKGVLRGIRDGFRSVFIGDLRALRYLGRSLGLYGSKEFYAANREGHVMDAAIGQAMKNPGLFVDGVVDAANVAYQNANSYDVSRMVSRTLTGATFAPLGALAMVGDVTYGVENGRVAFEDSVKHMVYGYE